MKHAIEDWIEEEDDALGADLLEALGGLAPEPEDFAAGVAERIRAAGDTSEDPLHAPLDGDRGGGGDALELGGSPLLRWAAGVLPPVVLPKGLTKFGLGAGSAAASKLGLKLVPGLAMMPIVTVLMMAVTAFVALRGLFGRGREDHDGEQTYDQREAQHEVADWWRGNKVPAALVLALIVYLWFQAPHDALVVLLLASTLVFVGVVGRLATAGLASRRELGKRLGGGLLFCLGISFQLRSAQFEETSAFSGAGPALLVLSGGAALLFALAYANRRGGLLRSLALVAPLWLLGIAGLQGLHHFVGKHEVTTADLRAWLEAAEDPELAAPVHWDRIVASVQHLQAAGLPLPELGRFAAVAQAQVDAQGADFNSLYALPLLRFERAAGVVRPSDRRGWLEARRLSSCWSWNPKFARPLDRFDLIQLLAVEDQDELRDEVVRWYDAELAGRLTGPSNSGRDLWMESNRERGRGAWLEVSPEPDALLELCLDELERRALTVVAEPDEYLAIASYLRATEALELIGRGERAAELAPLAQAALERTFTPSNDGRQAAFPGTWEHQTRDEDGELDERYLSFVWLETTAQALEAIARWGLAEDTRVDLSQLEGYLEAQRMVYRSRGLEPTAGLAAAALAHLRSLPIYAARNTAVARYWYDPLVAHRMLLAALLLVAFALTATLRAPEQALEPAPLRGDVQRFLLSQDEELVPGRGVRWWTVVKRMLLDSRSKD